MLINMEKTLKPQKRKQVFSLKDAQRLAKERGGKCLSTEYINARSKLKWECSKEHQWESTYTNIQRGRWCPVCARLARRNSIEDAQRLAEKRGGKCLSTEYINVRSKLKWECSKGHQWEATYANVQRGTWCPVCSGRQRFSIENAQRLANERGGKCLSIEYINTNSKLKWECSKGHQWEATYANVQRGTWCPVCAKLARRNSIEDAQRLAKERGGKCLSTEYINVRSKLKWECSKGHQWEATYASVQCGVWCRRCIKKNYFSSPHFILN